ncbi:KAP family P-loop NTPase fold protein [Faecalicatena contorta]|uniref:KAP family P-loop NTPase fold protein n=1 Tax=Faecalicatena contorta TaxID=39482 RepID=UPI00156706B4|nr:P-loop NTPase fold protein [Faecalicatena contorta]
MWNDIETTTDYLHFSVVSKTAADLIIESGDNPISIGISGSWGTGKSSMVKMIGKDLNEQSSDNNYIFLEFNAWLYQGYEDAKSALLQSVTTKLTEEMKKQKIDEDGELGKKFKNFLKRINWFQVSKLALPLLAGLIPGATPVGVIANFANAIKSSWNNRDKKSENSEAINTAIEGLAPELENLLNDNEEMSEPVTKQIEEIRKEFQEILKKLKVKLVVLVDDLDRCLPETAISTLEAMRLLLFVERTAFIIAADEQMIRNGVRAHFNGVELSDELVTSYFDKLIQVPIKIPHLGIAEVKVYIVLLFLELEVKRNRVGQETFLDAQNKLSNLLYKAWEDDVTAEKIEGVFDADTEKTMKEYVAIADQLAGILVSADNIKGNPRLIKRLLNALEIRKKVAQINGMTLDSGVLIKMLLFERCASEGAFDYLAKEVANAEEGKPEFIQKLEDSLISGEKYEPPDVTWNNDFVQKWVLIEPKLGGIDLRPLLYLSRDKALSFVAYDELSIKGKELLNALKKVKNGTYLRELVESIKSLGIREAEKLFKRIISLGRNEQWNVNTLFAAVHITEAFPELGRNLASALCEIPAKSRKAPIIPVIAEKEWAKDMLKQWTDDSETPDSVIRAITQNTQKK